MFASQFIYVLTVYYYYSILTFRRFLLPVSSFLLRTTPYRTGDAMAGKNLGLEKVFRFLGFLGFLKVF